MKTLGKLLEHPLVRGVDIDDPRAAVLRGRIVREKKFLRRLYEEWYGWVARQLPDGDGEVLEIGAGAGFMREYAPGLITSEVFFVPGISLVMDGRGMPFKRGALKAVVMVDVLHHVPDPAALLREAAGCVRPGGKLVMIEPWVTAWSSFVYRRFHHEPFEPDAVEWKIHDGGPLSGANGAMPWIIFSRDRDRFRAEHPEWKIDSITPDMPLAYLLSGGVSMRSLAPSWSYGILRVVERALGPLAGRLAMFARIVLVRREIKQKIHHEDTKNTKKR